MKASKDYMSADEIQAAVQRANKGERVILWWIGSQNKGPIGFDLKPPAQFRHDKERFSISGYQKLEWQQGVHLRGSYVWDPTNDGVFANFWLCYAHKLRCDKKPNDSESK